MKINRIIAHVVILLTLLNIPSILLHTQSQKISSPASYFTYFLLAVLIVTNKREFPRRVIALASIASLYYLISALKYDGEIGILLLEYVKLLLNIFGLFICLRLVEDKTLIIVLSLGALTILLDSLFFRFNDVDEGIYVSKYDRYAGFYLNPNFAAIFCLLGFAITLRYRNFKPFGIFFIFMGLSTLSRSFLLMLIVLILINFINDRKRLIQFSVFFSIVSILFVKFSDKLNLNEERSQLITGLLSGDLKLEVLTSDSRLVILSNFSDLFFNSPFVGNGFKALSGTTEIQGVHNSFLLVLGESGVLPFVLLVIFFYHLFRDCWEIKKYYKTSLHLFSICCVVMIATHNFFSSILIFPIIYLIKAIDNGKKIKYNKKCVESIFQTSPYRRRI